jgi:hypothetical protein
VAISATAAGALVWFDAVKETAGWEVYPDPPKVTVMVEILNVEQERVEEAAITAVADAPDPPPPENPMAGGVDEE